MPIRVLPPEIASRIAAGEVVERPASVVKELIENALDAGAHTIQVEIQEGGARLMRVSDDGCGIPADEVELAFARHATSKLRSVDDLDHIGTLGFRGEALASIAAVSQLEMSTRAAGEDLGVALRLVGGEIVHRQPTGRPPGTRVSVENLFFNVPARRKFLRSPLTEAGHIQELVTFYALAYPDRRFSLTHDGRQILLTTGSGTLRDVLVEAMGVDIAGQLIPLDQEASGDVEGYVHVSGFISPPSLTRANRSNMIFFVNGRWIRDRSLAYAVVQAYHTMLPAGRFPISIIHITLDPSEVDVNVHPTKSEVRFRTPGRIFSAVQRSVRATLLVSASPPQGYFPQGEDALRAEGIAGWDPARRAALLNAGRDMVDAALNLIPPAEERPLEGMEGFADTARQRLPILRVVGQVRQMYIIAEGPDGLYLIDQHAAHERVLYERLRAGLEAGGIGSQHLLEPTVVHVGLGQQACVEDYADLLERAGFLIEPFGESSLLLRAIPDMLAGAPDPAQAFLDIVDELAGGETPLERARDAAVMAAVCKRSAVKAGQTLSHSEMEELVRQLEATSSPLTCPHGRPTMIHLSVDALARQFLRG